MFSDCLILRLPSLQCTKMCVLIYLYLHPVVLVCPAAWSAKPYNQAAIKAASCVCWAEKESRLGGQAIPGLCARRHQRMCPSVSSLLITWGGGRHYPARKLRMWAPTPKKHVFIVTGRHWGHNNENAAGCRQSQILGHHLHVPRVLPVKRDITLFRLDGAP